ncbi:MAG: hypothetical protein Q8P90_03185 [bacterium]|nr:hypothetical protein [bacterium]
MNFKDLEPNDYIHDSDGKDYRIVDVFNKNTPAQQVLLADDYYPILISELVKLGYGIGRKAKK